METHRVLTRDTEKRAVNRVLRGTLYASVLAAVALVVLLVIASSNSAILERHYTGLVYATIGLAGLLLLLVLELVRRLVRRLRAGVFGTRLTIRLALSLIVMTLVPAIFIYITSVQVLGRSVESWFDVPVERALESGLNLGRAALDSQITDIQARARRLEMELVETSPVMWPIQLERLREQLGLQDVVIMTAAGKVLATSGPQHSHIAVDLPPPNALRQVRLSRQYASIEGGEGTDRSLRVRVMRQISAGNFGDEPRLIQIIQTIPSAIADNAERVQRGQRDYQELSLARQGLKRIYAITLTLTLLLTIFSAIAAAFLLAGWLTGPLTQLADGTRAVAAGDFRPMKDYSGRDELGTLTESFNAMTRQLDEARTQVQHQRDELLESNLKLEAVLTSISVAVVVFDHRWNLQLANGPARTMIQKATQTKANHEAPPGPVENPAAIIGMPLDALPWFGQFKQTLIEQFAEPAQAMLRTPSVMGLDSPVQYAWELQSDISVGSTVQTWLIRGTRLTDESIHPSIRSVEAGYLVVFEEITARLSAQRADAWSEVARRLAHEIKNPLTPIQLAAERLEQKLAPKLEETDASFVARNTATIVDQVAALKQMVDEFREYARLPAAKLQPVRLADLVQDVVSLYPEEIEGVAIRSNFDRATPAVIGDPGQLRQVIHNLVKNAHEALEGRTDGLIEIRIEALRALRPEPVDAAPAVPHERRRSDVTSVRLIVRDNGPGFPAAIQNREFEPYVTTKPKGTGLGLAIVKKIADEHGAAITLGTHPQGSSEAPGAQVTLEFVRLHDNRGQQRGGSDHNPDPNSNQTPLGGSTLP